MHHSQRFINAMLGLALLLAALLPVPVKAKTLSLSATDPGVKLLLDIFPGSSDSRIYSAIPFGSKVFFYADDGTHGLEPWISDGTLAGTHIIKDTRLGGDGVQIRNFDPVPPVFWNGKVYYAGIGSSGLPQLWVSDGTSAGTYALTTATHPIITMRAGVHGVMFQDAVEGTNKMNFWWTDGTTQNTFLVHSWDEYYAGFYTFFELNNDIYTLDHSHELWKFNLPTRQALFLDRSTYMYQVLKTVNGWVVYGKRPTMAYSELWETTGSTQSNKRLATNIFWSGDFLTIGNLLYAIAGPNDVSGLYTTSAGTSGLNLISEGRFQGLTDIGGKLLTQKLSTNGRYSPWRSDGTASGTVPLCSTCINQLESYFPGFVSVSNQYLYRAKDGAGSELWVTDGSEDGSHRLTDINPGAASSTPDQMVAMGTYVFFVADDGKHGREPYIYRPVSRTFTPRHDSVKALIGRKTVFDVMANDSKAAGQTLYLVGFDAKTSFGGTLERDDRGTPTNLADDRILYTQPQESYGGDPDDFAYWISVGGSSIAIGRVTVQVPRDSSPTAIKFQPSILPGPLETVPVGTLVGMLSVTDSDAGDSHTCTSNSPNMPFTINGLKVITSAPLDYEPNPLGYTVSVTCKDFAGFQVNSNIKILVQDVNLPPIFTSALKLSTSEDAINSGGSISFTDPEGSLAPITLSAATQPAHGNASIADCFANTCSLQYTPNPDYNGPDTLTLMLKDSGGATTKATYTITVSAGNNDPPLMFPPPDTVVSNLLTNIHISLDGISPGPYETGPVAITASTDTPAMLTNLAVNYSTGPHGFLSFVLDPLAGNSASVTVTLDDGTTKVPYTFNVLTSELPPLYLPLLQR